jgi:hypothetical protein
VLRQHGKCLEGMLNSRKIVREMDMFLDGPRNPWSNAFLFCHAGEGRH